MQLACVIEVACRRPLLGVIFGGDVPTEGDHHVISKNRHPEHW
jgi:hypothetical protein